MIELVGTIDGVEALVALSAMADFVAMFAVAATTTTDAAVLEENIQSLAAEAIKRLPELLAAKQELERRKEL
jgi:hypothetical protein